MTARYDPPAGVIARAFMQARGRYSPPASAKDELESYWRPESNCLRFPCEARASPPERAGRRSGNPDRRRRSKRESTTVPRRGAFAAFDVLLPTVLVKPHTPCLEAS